MSYATDRLAKYLHLARAAQQRQRNGVRDHLLAVAAVEADERSLTEAAEGCRRLIVANNPGHILARFDSVGDAMRDEGFAAFYRKALRRYTLERVEQLLARLRIDPASERATYASDAEYADGLVAQLKSDGDQRPDAEGIAHAADWPESESPADADRDRPHNPYAAPRAESPRATTRRGLAKTPPSPWGNLVLALGAAMALALAALALGPCSSVFHRLSPPSQDEPAQTE